MKKGDRVSIYMPMVVELVVAMLACVRIGAVHSIVVSVPSSSSSSGVLLWSHPDAVFSLQVSLLSLCVRGSWTLSVLCSSLQVSVSRLGSPG